MGQEIIGSLTEWEPGWETDMAYDLALCFLNAALGAPPTGVNIQVVYCDHELGSYPSLAVCWEDFGSEPSDYVRRAEAALREFDGAIDWYRIRPSRFAANTEEQ